jgi:UDP:flavonoid glycosyltransferase YjiC (YdhE family)
MPKRIVITSFGSLGDIYPYLGLARQLTHRGHEALFATSAYYRPLIENAGVAFCPIRPDVSPADHAMIRRLMDPERGPELLIREVLMPHVQQAYVDLAAAACGADLLVTHPITFAGPLVAEQHQVRWVSTVLAPMSFFSAYDLPVFPSLLWLAWLRRLGPRVGRGLIRLGKWMTRRWTEPIRQLRTDLGLPTVADPLYEGQFSPGLTLALFSRLLATPQPDWPIHTQVTGFSFYQEPDGLPPEVEHFLETGPAPLVFTLGSSAVSAAGPFYQESIEAARRLGCRAVLLVGMDPQNQPREPLPPGMLAVPYAPHGDLFPRALAIIHQGGIGTTAQALRAGRPMLVVPHAFDQPDNAARVSNLGVARTLFPKHYTATRAVAQLRVLLENPAYAQRAAEAADTVRAEDGVQCACVALEGYLATSTRATSPA